MDCGGLEDTLHRYGGGQNGGACGSTCNGVAVMDGDIESNIKPDEVDGNSPQEEEDGGAHWDSLLRRREDDRKAVPAHVLARPRVTTGVTVVCC